MSSMSVFVLEDLCFSLSSLPPKEAIVPVVSNDMMDGVVWYKKRVVGGGIENRSRGPLRSFESRRIR